MSVLAQSARPLGALEQAARAFIDTARTAAEPAFLGALRRRAAEYFREHGFPHTKLEHWRFTSLRSLVRVPFEPALRHAATPDLWGIVDELLGPSDAFRILIVNGFPALPDASAPSGVELMSMAELLRSAPERLETELGRISTLAFSGAALRADCPTHGFEALNTAAFEDGLVLFVRRGARVERPIELVHVGLSTEATTLALPRVLVLADADSELKLIETSVQHGAHEHLSAAVTEIAIGENASVAHVRLAYGTSRSSAIGVVAARVGRQARFGSHVATLGGKLARLDLRVLLAGDGAESTLDGLYLVDADEHVDHQTLIEHAAPHTTSLEKYKGVLAGSGHAVFDGTIVVNKGAIKTSAHQENRNILLSDDAVVNTKPHLEIDADDVRCSHGATVGQIDPVQVHYLRTRGIGEHAARAIVTYAFAREIVDRIPIEAARREIGSAMIGRLPEGHLVEELLT